MESSTPDRALAFRSVVWATDFSAVVPAAGRYAALLAQQYDAELIVVHAFSLLAAAREAEELGHVRSKQREHLENLFSDAVKQLTPPPRKSIPVLREGTPVEVIGQVLEEHQPALLVLATHGAGAVERHVIGSVAEEILRTVNCPVMTVGPHVVPPSPGRFGFHHILYATDFTPAAAQAGAYAFALAQAFGSEIDVLHLVPQGSVAERELEKEKEALLTYLAQLVPPVPGNLLPRVFVESGNVRRHILEHARQQGSDLIVLGVHHHSRLAMHFRTGPAFQVIVEANCPVLTVCTS